MNFFQTKTRKQADLFRRQILMSAIAAISISLALVISISVPFTHRNNFLLRDNASSLDEDTKFVKEKTITSSSPSTDSQSVVEIQRLDEAKLNDLAYKDRSLKVTVSHAIDESNQNNKGSRTTSSPRARNPAKTKLESRSSKNTAKPTNLRKRSSKKPYWTLNGLLSPSYTKPSCISRHESVHYHKSPPRKPSTYLISKLRSYEALHRRCGPNTVAYNRTLQRLLKPPSGNDKHGNVRSESVTCKYIIWVPDNGLGNRMLSLASTFLFGLLSDRVLLLDHLARDMTELFCEPFPYSSWLLPDNFPVSDHVSRETNVSYTSSDERSSPPQFMYMDPDRSDTFLDKTPFYCEQAVGSELRDIPWLILLSDQYYVPYFFLKDPFKEDVDLLFPEKDSVFHLLARYLFHPSNEAWGLISRFYETYLSRSDKRVGLQVRLFYPDLTPPTTVIEQIYACNRKEKLLPELDIDPKNDSAHQKNKTWKAILVASLNSDFYNNISAAYWTRPTKSGELVEVYQATHEGNQKFKDASHDMKAWAEIYLLSMTDVLVTSAWSTFGYVAQGLSGTKSWVLTEGKDDRVPNPPCFHETSIEPCYHFPPVYDCNTKRKTDPGAVLPFLKRCTDVKQGVKLVNVPNNGVDVVA